MRGKTVLLGITGGIAAYKSAELCRAFIKEGAVVQVVMSESAREFISPLTLETLSGRSVPIEMFGRSRRPLEHIDLGDGADVMVVAPATADYIARCRAGRASDLISSVTLAFNGPVVFSPAMNTNMWNNPATVSNVKNMIDVHGWHMVPPDEGALACGIKGPGRMAEPERILAYTKALFKSDFQGKKVIVTAGPTVEDIDPVRFLSNRSTGKMGYAIAEEAKMRGAIVCLISGPTAIEPPQGIEFVPVRSALQMQQAINCRADSAHAIVMAAAVADFRPKEVVAHKLKKGISEIERNIELVRNPDILAELGNRFADKDVPLLVGFALETESLLEAAKKKIESKKIQLIVANLAKDGFAKNTNSALIIDDTGQVQDTGLLSKKALAGQILDALAKRMV